MHRQTESMAARNGEIEEIERAEDSGIGVRALVGQGWGFHAVPDLSLRAVRTAGEKAARTAAASELVSNHAVELLQRVPIVGTWAPVCDIDPLSVPLSSKGDLLTNATRIMHRAGGDQSRGIYRIWETRKWFVSSEGHRIDQHIRECGGGISATVLGDGETQRRSYPSYRGQYGTRGWELVQELDLTAHGERIVNEARQLITAPVCPAANTTVIIGSEQMALQIHESVGHAIELDRILGWEAAYAGTSWLNIGQLGTLRFGSDLVNIVIDPRQAGALGSFGYDDEGNAAARRDAIRNGIWVGVLAGRDSATVAGLDYAGSMRSDGWARLPMVRMTNVGLEPGPHTLDQMISATDEGIYMDGNRSWSIDDKRLNFQFGCEIAWEVRNGKIGRILRNPTYTGIGPHFWRSMDMLSSEVVAWGTPYCGKGQPSQDGHTSHPSAPARFTNVRVGIRG